MSDAFDLLRSTTDRAEPDPVFRARLIESLGRALDASATNPPGPVHATTTRARDDTLVALDRLAPTRRDRVPRGRRVVLVVASLGVAVTAAVAIIARERSHDVTPAISPVATRPLETGPSSPSATGVPTAPTTTASTTTSSSTTTVATTTSIAFDPAIDSEIAKAMLLTAEEFGQGWTTVAFKDVVLDREVAATVPGCAAYLDTVFEGPGRRAVTDFRHFQSPLPAILRQYVVVFPHQDDAQAMFDATTESEFGDDCFRQYYERTDEYTGNWCCDPEDPATPPLYGRTISTSRTFGADDIDLRVDDGQYWTDADGVVHGPETLTSATLRVGRAIIVLEAILRDEFGNPVQTEAEFESVLSVAASRAREALEG